jgi:hypothetical protein
LLPKALHVQTIRFVIVRLGTSGTYLNASMCRVMFLVSGRRIFFGQAKGRLHGADVT